MHSMSTLTKYLIVFGMSMVPVIELRGAVPYGVAAGLPLLPVLIALVPVTFLVMATAGRVTQRFAKAEPELEEELANDDAQ